MTHLYPDKMTNANTLHGCLTSGHIVQYSNAICSVKRNSDLRIELAYEIRLILVCTSMIYNNDHWVFMYACTYSPEVTNSTVTKFMNLIFNKMENKVTYN